ncbi:hypothetical protein LGH83_04535 [Lichenihabitans sp. PAMC28606]|uniref:hypothetical protein n=1 Tax=Lichenihabitans sp. PAMC28606 TaxID=2880932 RepID=UPI001D09B839|nr:hypothetical protein [Lichenihabitans sp. PAMC28606]UDL95494.1 hypothetical protein LGH83_04535 [Lichenihabitans sp. PAMC28606]
MTIPGMERHRDKNGEISKKHGNTLVSTLRKIYGDSFAHGFPGHTKLSDVLEEIDDRSLTELVKDHDTGHLLGKLDQHG